MPTDDVTAVRLIAAEAYTFGYAMIENYRTGLLWNIMGRCPAVVAGLRRAGFNGGWL